MGRLINKIRCLRPFRRIKYFIDWFPIVWNDEWYDQGFLFEVMKFKISQMEKKTRKEGVHIGHQKTAHSMKVSALLLDRLIKDDYWEIVGKFHNKKWGEPTHSTKPTGNPLLNELILSRPNVVTKEDKEQESKEFRRCGERENYLRNQDLEYLFHIMRRTIWNWWD